MLKIFLAVLFLGLSAQAVEFTPLISRAAFDSVEKDILVEVDLNCSNAVAKAELINCTEFEVRCDYNLKIESDNCKQEVKPSYYAIPLSSMKSSVFGKVLNVDLYGAKVGKHKSKARVKVNQHIGKY